MDKKLFWGNFISVLSAPFIIVSLITMFSNPIIGTILISVGLILLFIGIFIRSKFYESLCSPQSHEMLEPTMSVEDNKKSNTQREKEYEIYLDAKTALMIQAFSILSDKRMNKETRARKLRKIIRSNPFNVDKFDD